MRTEADQTQSPPYAKPATEYYTLFLLTVVYVFNFIDRQILSILQEPIKRDLGLSDGQLGLLTGFAFAVFYVVAGIPIARFADRSIRRNIVACSVAIWSVMTAMSGFAQNYMQLLIARTGVGIGEAGGSPPAQSMISDIFPPEKRASALSIYNTGINIGVLFGFLIGGWLNHFFGWRMALIFVGIPGIILALLVRFTITEPLRNLSAMMIKAQETLSLKQICQLLWSRKSFRYLSAGAALNAFVTYSVLNWIAPFMIRVHNMDTGELGTMLALNVGLAGGIGTFAFGILSDRLAKHDKRWYTWLPALIMFVSVPAYIAVFRLTSSGMIMLVLVLPMLLMTASFAPILTMIHGMVASNMRATSSSLLLVIISIVGLGLGPWLVGLTSDYLHPAYGRESIRYALLYIMPAVALVAGLLFLGAGKQLREDMANAPR